MEKRGRKAIDGKRRTVRIAVRFTPQTAALLEAVRGNLSKNELMTRALRHYAAHHNGIRDAHLTTQEALRGPD